MGPLKIILDAGIVSNRSPNCIFITHSHVDHSWNLPLIYGARTTLIKGYENLGGRPVFAPSSAWPIIKQLEQCCHNLSVGYIEDTEDIMKEQRVAPFIVTSNQKYDNIPGLKGIVVETFECYHPSQTVGYGFCTEVQKLKQEYQNLKGPEIGKLKKSGEIGRASCRERV